MTRDNCSKELAIAELDFAKQLKDTLDFAFGLLQCGEHIGLCENNVENNVLVWFRGCSALAAVGIHVCVFVFGMIGVRNLCANYFKRTRL